AGILAEYRHGSRSSDGYASRAPLSALRSRAILIAPTPGSPAIVIARTLQQAGGGAIAGTNHGKLALPASGYQTGHDVDGSDEEPWFELHVASDGVHLLDPSTATQTVIAWNGAALDRDALLTAYAKLRDGSGRKDPAVDVLVGDGVTAQQLV